MQNRPFNKATSSPLQRNLNQLFCLANIVLARSVDKSWQRATGFPGVEQRQVDKGLKAELRQVPGSRGALTLLWVHGCEPARTRAEQCPE